MSFPAGKYLGGIRDEASLLGRCRVDPDHGCWRWSQCCDAAGPRMSVRMADGVYRVLRGRRAAAVVGNGGTALPPGKIAYGSPECPYSDCVLPAHALLGTRAQAIQAAVKRGAFDTPARAAALEVLQQGQRKVSKQTTLEIASAPGTCRELAKQHGLSLGRVAKIRRGECNMRQRAASVFEWRP